MNPEDTIAVIMALRLSRAKVGDTEALEGEAKFAARLLATAKIEGLPLYLRLVKEWRDAEAKAAGPK